MQSTHLRNLIHMLAVLLCLCIVGCDGGSGGSQQRSGTRIPSVKSGKGFDANRSSSNKEDKEALIAQSGEGERHSLPVLLQKSGGPTEYQVKNVEYGSGVNIFGESRKLVGLYVRAAGNMDPGPAILMIHSNSGLIKSSMEKIAAHFAVAGYRFLAIDLFGRVPANETEADDMDKMQVQKGKADVLSNVSQARNYLLNYLDATKVVIAGLGSGGTWALTAAASYEKQFAAAISYYGGPEPFLDNKEKFAVPVQMIFSTDDMQIAKEDIAKMAEEFKDHEPSVQVLGINGVSTGFMEPARVADYNSDETARVIESTINFLKPIVVDQNN